MLKLKNNISNISYISKMANQNCEQLQKLVDELLKKQKESKENEDTLQEYFLALEEDKNELFGKLVNVQTKLDDSEIKVNELKLSLSESIIENEHLQKQLKDLGSKFKKCRELYLNNSNELKSKKDQISYLESQFLDITTKNIEDEKKYNELVRKKEQSDRDNSLKISILSKEKIELAEEKIELIKSLISLMFKNRIKTKIQKDRYYTDLKRIKYSKKSNENSNKILIEKFKKKYLDLENDNLNLKNTVNHFNNIIPALNHQIQCLSRTPYQTYY